MKKLSKFYFLAYFLFLGWIFFFIMTILYLNMNMIYLCEVELLMINSINFNYMVYLDWMSFLFISIVLFISMLIMVYSKIYMGLECHRFLWLTILFIMFMIIMILSPSCLGVLLGWDGLGIISYCLVIYYKSFDAFNSGFITAATNRLGDSMLLLSIVWFSMEGVFMFFENPTGSIFFMLACMTKSAQFPFCAWLPSAMAAPTPISSLVHSSTLVTAGVYMMIRFYFCYVNSGFMWVLLIFSFLTILIAGASALGEYDLKRMIALSTLGQLGYMILIMCVGHPSVAFFHLLVHALFKALLFMCGGSIIHSIGGIQDLRKMGNLLIDPVTKCCLNISLMNLMGLPFTSGFYSKDSLIELMCMSYPGVSIGMLFFLMIILTISYSMRMIIYTSSSKGWVIYTGSSFYLSLSLTILTLFNIFMGCFLCWISQEICVINLSKGVKLLPVYLITVGILWYGVVKKKKTSEFFMMSMFYMVSMTKMVSLLILLFMNTMKMMDQGWFESFIFNLKKMSLMSSKYLKIMCGGNFMIFTGSFLIAIFMVSPNSSSGE